MLIFDEVITGFRLGMAGAQGYFGVVPDLATFGKAMANGFPDQRPGGKGRGDGARGRGEGIARRDHELLDPHRGGRGGHPGDSGERAGPRPPL